MDSVTSFTPLQQTETAATPVPSTQIGKGIDNAQKTKESVTTIKPTNLARSFSQVKELSTNPKVWQLEEGMEDDSVGHQEEPDEEWLEGLDDFDRVGLDVQRDQLNALYAVLQNLKGISSTVEILSQFLKDRRSGP